MASDKTKIRRIKMLIEDEKLNIELYDEVLKEDSITELQRRKLKRNIMLSNMSIEAAEFWLKCHENEDENN